MNDRKPYKTTSPEIEWIAGRRVQDGKIELTDAEAQHDLARGNIELDLPEEPAKKSALRLTEKAD
ncbi:MAG: hypothetical protein ACRDBL_09045 [Rhabdaerophilum sp.]